MRNIFQSQGPKDKYQDFTVSNFYRNDQISVTGVPVGAIISSSLLGDNFLKAAFEANKISLHLRAFLLNLNVWQGRIIWLYWGSEVCRRRYFEAVETTRTFCILLQVIYRIFNCLGERWIYQVSSCIAVMKTKKLAYFWKFLCYSFSVILIHALFCVLDSDKFPEFWNIPLKLPYFELIHLIGDNLIKETFSRRLFLGLWCT